MNNILGKRIQERRQLKNLKQKELAKLLNISRETISAYENGRTQPPPAILQKLAQILETSVDYLIGITDDPRPFWERANIQIYPEEEFKEIPVYNGARAGNEGAYPDGSTIIEYVKIPKDIPGKFGVKVFGDSMEPEICDGDVVVVNPDLAYASGDRVVVVLGDPYFIEPAAVVKIYREQNGVRYLQSRNEKYPPIVLTEDTHVHFVGKVVGLVRKY
ncbi:hypothetical protein DRP07_11140 [Archaeoglobales archaeon]|nr:MAG: hypothetical protein DRP07_11140 [Archaeoglobales archaeon]